MQKLAPSSSASGLVCGVADHAPGVAASVFHVPPNLWNICYTFSGTVREVLGPNITQQKADDFMVLKPGGSHRWEVPRDAAENWRAVWFLVPARPEWVPLLDLPELFPRFSLVSLSANENRLKIRRALLSAGRLARLPRGGTALAMNALERAFLWLDATQPGRHARLDPRVEATIELFTRRLAQPPSIAEAATACGLSASRLRDLFVEATGQTPQESLEIMRLNQARYLLLSTGLPVKLIAAAVGYDDQRYFATRFGRQHGTSPALYRARALARQP